MLASAHVMDMKFPLVTIPHSGMQSEHVKNSVHEAVAAVVSWSLRAASLGTWPLKGPFGEDLVGFRSEMAGKPLCGGIWKGVYFGFRGDEKARKELHSFTRSYMHNKVCMYCFAENHNKNLTPGMLYKNFHHTAPHRLATISPSC